MELLIAFMLFLHSHFFDPEDAQRHPHRHVCSEHDGAASIFAF